jgi:hypothetical protein
MMAKPSKKALNIEFYVLLWDLDFPSEAAKTRSNITIMCLVIRVFFSILALTYHYGRHNADAIFFCTAFPAGFAGLFFPIPRISFDFFVLMQFTI